MTFKERLNWSHTNALLAQVRTAVLLLAAVACFEAIDLDHRASGQTWTRTSAPNDGWRAVASSADGSVVVVAADSGPACTSTNSGLTWHVSSIGGVFFSAASSIDGGMLAVGSSFQIYISRDAGVTWTTNAPFARGFWSALASSADGTRLVTGGNNTVIYTSANSGATWTSNNTPRIPWYAATSSADGNTLAVIPGPNHSGPIYTSTNAGVTWNSNNSPSLIWGSIASSADGTRLVAAAQPGVIYSSSDSGSTWTTNNTPTLSWAAVASSADGTKLVAATLSPGPIYSSSDSGNTWVTNNSPNTNWYSLASSPDGSKLLAGAWQGLYASTSTPTPLLSVSPFGGGLAISWILPSMNFVLQQTSDLVAGTWSNVPTTPALNLAKLKYEVLVPNPLNNAFYRLRSP